MAVAPFDGGEGGDPGIVMQSCLGVVFIGQLFVERLLAVQLPAGGAAGARGAARAAKPPGSMQHAFKVQCGRAGQGSPPSPITPPHPLECDKMSSCQVLRGGG